MGDGPRRREEKGVGLETYFPSELPRLLRVPPWLIRPPLLIAAVSAINERRVKRQATHYGQVACPFPAVITFQPPCPILPPNRLPVP